MINHIINKCRMTKKCSFSHRQNLDLENLIIKINFKSIKQIIENLLKLKHLIESNRLVDISLIFQLIHYDNFIYFNFFLLIYLPNHFMIFEN